MKVWATIYHHLEDVQSDLSVFHRIDDIWSEPAQSVADKFVRLAAYRGIIRTRIESELYAQNDSTNATPAHQGSGRNGPENETRVVDSDAHTLQTDPALQGMFEVKVAADAGQGVQAT